MFAKICASVCSNPYRIFIGWKIISCTNTAGNSINSCRPCYCFCIGTATNISLAHEHQSINSEPVNFTVSMVSTKSVFQLVPVAASSPPARTISVFDYSSIITSNFIHLCLTISFQGGRLSGETLQENNCNNHCSNINLHVLNRIFHRCAENFT